VSKAGKGGVGCCGEGEGVAVTEIGSGVGVSETPLQETNSSVSAWAKMVIILDFNIEEGTLMLIRTWLRVQQVLLLDRLAVDDADSLGRNRS
jgi:hypothetical protein